MESASQDSAFPSGGSRLERPPDPALLRLADRVRAAYADSTPLRIRGGGSKDFYGGRPFGEPMEIGPLQGITDYEPTEMVLTARAGTLLSEVEETLAARGQCLSFEPPRFGASGTIGGMVGAGLAGPARACVGGIRDYLLGVVILNGKGELLRFGGQVMKNVAGYDVSRAFAGSLGILGVICEVSIKVPPVPAARATLRFPFGQVEALARLHEWSSAGVPVRASAWHAGELFVQLAGAAAAVQAGAGRLEESGGTRIDPAAATALWGDLRDHRHPFFTRPGSQALWRLSVPSSRPPLDLEGDLLIEWGGAQRWLRSELPAARIREIAARAGGHAVAFRGCGDADFLSGLPGPLERIHRGLKRSFDPAGIFNPGRLYPWL